MSDITIDVLQTGRVRVAPGLPFRSSRNPLAPLGLGPKARRIWLPVNVYLVRTSHGSLLFDTGWGTGIRGNQRAYLHFPNNVPNYGELPHGQEITTLLAGCHITPSDLDVVMLSHLDLDHASGLHEVGTAKRILCSRLEYEAAERSHIRYVKSMWEDESLEPFDFDESALGPFGRSLDLYGDGILTAVWLPGHTVGSTGLIVRNLETDDFVILAGDCGYAHKSWERMIEPGLAVNRGQLKQSLSWLHDQAQDPHCIDILACHDGEVVPQTIYVE